MDKYCYDKDGFIHLSQTPKNTETTTKSKGKSKATAKKTVKNPFKKGSWKHSLMKIVLKAKKPNDVSHFHGNRQRCYIISLNSGSKVKAFADALPKNKIDKFNTKYPESTIMIDTFNHTYTKVSTSSYLKLMKVSRIVIEYDIRLSEDPDYDTDFDDMMIVRSNTVTIDSINQFLNFVNFYRIMVAIDYDTIMNYSIGNYVYKVRTVVSFTDGTIKTFKGDFNEVLEYFKITPLL